jgi:hypothetical protein
MIMLTEYVDIYVLILVFIIGLLVTYIITPVPKTLIKYPTPDNIGKVMYIDDNNVCYKYKMVEVICPIDNSKITIIQN